MVAKFWFRMPSLADCPIARAFVLPRHEHATADPYFQRILSLKETCSNLLLVVQRAPSASQTVAEPRLGTLTAWLAHCGVAYMKLRCDAFLARVENIKKLASSQILEGAMNLLDKVDFETISPADSKTLTHASGKSTEMKQLVSEFNEWEIASAWPTVIHERLSPIHSGVKAKLDLLDAQAREAATQVHSAAKYIIVNCTGVQALLKSGTNQKAPATRLEFCSCALDRAEHWGVALKPSVRTASRMSSRHERRPPDYSCGV